KCYGNRIRWIQRCGPRTDRQGRQQPLARRRHRNRRRAYRLHQARKPARLTPRKREGTTRGTRGTRGTKGTRKASFFSVPFVPLVFLSLSLSQPRLAVP